VAPLGSFPAGKKAMSWPNDGTDIRAGTVAGPRRNAFKTRFNGMHSEAPQPLVYAFDRV
jgi:hypothetical protein